MLFYKCEIIVTGNKLHSYQNSSVLLIYFFKNFIIYINNAKYEFHCLSISYELVHQLLMLK